VENAVFPVYQESHLTYCDAYARALLSNAYHDTKRVRRANLPATDEEGEESRRSSHAAMAAIAGREMKIQEQHYPYHAKGVRQGACAKSGHLHRGFGLAAVRKSQ
jgi:hypothetical protein